MLHKRFMIGAGVFLTISFIFILMAIWTPDPPQKQLALTAFIFGMVGTFSGLIGLLAEE